MRVKLFSETYGVAKAAVRIALNSRSTSLNSELLGTTLTGEPVPIIRQDGWAYAAATNDRRPEYNTPDGIAPPLFAVKVLAGPMGRLLLHPDLGMNFLRMLHGEQAFTFHEPLRYQQTVVAEATITGFREVNTGEILDMGLELRGQQGERLVTGTSSFFVPRGTGSSAGRSKGPPGAAPFPEDAPGRFSRSLETDPTQPTRYAAASGDRNPIHTNAIIARLAGLPRPIMHGLCMMAMAGREVLGARDAAPTSLKQLSLRFTRTAFPGARYVIHGADAADGGLDFIVLDGKDRPVLSRGYARFS
ncbi:MAG: MaoC/PaaZ C-terminal domain-containing protein [Pseudomonadota bacterium]